MRRFVQTISIFIVTFVACGVAAAQQQQGRTHAPLADNASLEETLSWLDARLRQYGRFTISYSLYEPGLRYRTRFLGLKADGCSVTYNVSYERFSSASGNVVSPASDVTKPAVDGGPSANESTVNLSAIDPALVKGENPKKWDGGRVIFGAGRGKTAVSRRDRKGRLQEYEGGEFYVSEEGAVEEIAGALRRAVSACRQPARSSVAP